MKKIVLWVLAVLLGLPLLLGLTWFLLNRTDVAPQPWPEQLALPTNQVPDADNLLLQIAVGPQAKSVSLNECKEDDCLSLWRQQLPAWVEVQQKNAAFGERCEALTAPKQLRAEDPMPGHMSPDWVLPQFSPLVSCHGWLLRHALQAADGGDTAAALRWLRQADRADRALLTGARSLIGHMIGVSLWANKLQLITGLAPRHPELAGDLQALAALDPQTLLARQRDWMVVEANFARGAIDSMRSFSDCEALPAPLSWADRMICRIGGLGMQPEYATQLVSERALKLQALLAQGQSPAESLALVRPLLASDHSASLWQRIRHTVPHEHLDVAPPAYLLYMERAADLQLSAEATALWLRRGAPGEASPALRERLKSDAGWRLKPYNDQSRLPLRWTPLT